MKEVIVSGKPYKPGDKIGPYKIELVKKDHKNQRGEWYSWFLCPKCKKNLFLCSHKHIKDGGTTGCPECSSKKYNLVGQKFGHWIVLKDSGKRDKNRRIYWECQCDCGNNHIYLIDTSSLVLGRSQSCGCINSKGEDLLSTLFSQMKIKFIPQKTFEDCRNPKTNRKLYFDFYLPDYNCCIEYDGIQHFEKTNWSHDDLEERQIRDNIKNQYCKENNIKLIRISYKDFENITESFLWKVINE